jgi:hypothetical protein
MAIESTTPLNININIAIQNASADNISANVASETLEVQAPKNFAGRTVKLITDVTKWAVGESAGLAQRVANSAAKNIKAGAAFVAKKFLDAVRSLHEKFQFYQADKKANKQWNLSTARAEQRYAESPTAKTTSRLLQPMPQAQVTSHKKIIDQETKDIQTRLNILKLPDVPSADPNISK